MSSQISIKVASVTATVTLAATDQQVAAALTRYATSVGIPTTGTPTENLTAIIVHIVEDIKRRAKAAQIAELRAAQDADNQATVDSDNAL